MIETKKVLFSPRIDKFELLEIQGLYDIFYYQGRSDSIPVGSNTLSVKALSNGIMSRSTIFKLDGNIAEILNLVIEIKEGKIVGMDWKNSCIPKVCAFEDCIKNEFSYTGADGKLVKGKEKNCFIKTCTSSTVTKNCDTKVYVTWEGNDIENRYCESDNFRITNLMQHSIQSYFDAAINVSPVIISAEKAKDLKVMNGESP